MPRRRGVLLMAYGTPESLDDVEMYYRDIRGGATPSPLAVASLTERYRGLGAKPRCWKSPSESPNVSKRDSTSRASMRGVCSRG